MYEAWGEKTGRGCVVVDVVVGIVCSPNLEVHGDIVGSFRLSEQEVVKFAPPVHLFAFTD